MADTSAQPQLSVPAPALEILDLSSPHTFTKPTKCINEGSDVSHFLTSLAYRDIGRFILQLNHALCPRKQSDSPLPRVFVLTTTNPSTPSILALQTLLSDIASLTEEAPPDTGPRRFGNTSFRKWHAILNERAGDLLTHGPLGQALLAGNGTAREEAQNYLLGAFGNPQRLDYGTGHELSFLAFLGCLWKLGYFLDGNPGGDIEREIALFVLERYLGLVRKLIVTYTLEPAGSRGVWGLDDHFFVPYILGSAQLTRPIEDADPMPQEGSVNGAPKPSDVTRSAIVEEQRQVNMYFSAVGFISDVKKGPFWEHSPTLFDISGIKDGWGKINKGMIKMFNAEVLAKFPVVQHFPFGSLFSWDKDPDAVRPAQSVHLANQPSTPKGTVPPPVTSGGGTAALWDPIMGMPKDPSFGIPSLRAPPPGPPPSGSPGSNLLLGKGSASGSTSDTAQTSSTKAPWAKTFELA